MEKVSVVIPVYGRWDLAKRNIDALLTYDRGNIAEILVVDDCSPERNPYQFDSELVRILTTEKNLGYTGAVNKGLRIASSDIIMLLDSDAYPTGAFVKKLCSMYKNDPAIGCIGFGTIDDQGNDTGNYQYEPSILGLIAGQALEARLEFLHYRGNKNILPNSCAVSFRKACLDEVGYFDEQLFPVLEADVDISMRIHRSAWKLIFTKDIIVCHKGGNSYKVNYKRVLLYHKSRWQLLRKFGRIKFPSLAKTLVKARVRMELIVFNLLNTIKADKNFYGEKIKGRKILLEEVDLYN